MDVSDLELNAFFTTDGTDIWALESYYSGPSCRLKNLKTGDVQDFGMEGITASDFKRITMPVNPKQEKV